MTVPAAAEPRPARALRVTRRSSGSGIDATAVRRSGVPLVELRLKVPAPDMSAATKARKQLLAATMLGGTTDRDASAIARRLDEIGGTLGAGSGTDSLSLSGSALAAHLPDLLELVADVLLRAGYPADHVRNERGRISHQLVIRRSQPQAMASDVFRRRVFGSHPYGLGMPTPGAVGRIASPTLRQTHLSAVKPRGATLILTGDISPKAALDQAESALSGWSDRGVAPSLEAQPPLRDGPIRILDRPGAVQTNIRIGGHAVPRRDPGYAALDLANLVFGGYFASRLSANVREDKGYSYSPHSTISHMAAGSRFSVGADVATEVTAPALVEIRYELARMATAAAPPEEIEKARRYRVGALVAGTQTQAGLASTLLQLTAAGLDASYMRDHPLALRSVGHADVLAAAQEHFRPSRLVTVMVGDADRIAADLEAVDDVEVVRG